MQTADQVAKIQAHRGECRRFSKSNSDSRQVGFDALNSSHQTSSLEVREVAFVSHDSQVFLLMRIT